MYDLGERSCVMRGKKGFSRIELIVALLIIAVLVAAFLPRYIRYAQSGATELCALNRAAILRLYRAHELTDPACRLADVLDGSCTDFEDDTSDYTCPSGGLYAADGSTRIYCSRHGY